LDSDCSSLSAGVGAAFDFAAVVEERAALAGMAVLYQNQCRWLWCGWPMMSIVVFVVVMLGFSVHRWFWLGVVAVLAVVGMVRRFRLVGFVGFMNNDFMNDMHHFDMLVMTVMVAVSMSARLGTCCEHEAQHRHQCYTETTQPIHSKPPQLIEHTTAG
jgi:hypothetical protein